MTILRYLLICRHNSGFRCLWLAGSDARCANCVFSNGGNLQLRLSRCFWVILLTAILIGGFNLIYLSLENVANCPEARKGMDASCNSRRTRSDAGDTDGSGRASPMISLGLAFFFALFFTAGLHDAAAGFWRPPSRRAQSAAMRRAAIRFPFALGGVFVMPRNHIRAYGQNRKAHNRLATESIGTLAPNSNLSWANVDGLARLLEAEMSVVLGSCWIASTHQRWHVFHRTIRPRQKAQR